LTKENAMLVRRVWNARPSLGAPFYDFERMRRDMFRLAEALHDDGSLGDLFADGGAAHGVFPPLNVSQDNDAFTLRAELPGVDPKALSISAHHNRIEISGSRQIPREQEKVSYHRKERAEGSFSRAVTLPSEIDAERVEARYADGILTLTVPKAERAKPRQIQVH
jgi:HSP20 family protein